MSPDQFTLWLRGVFDACPEGQAIPADVALKVHEKLTEVVGQQVANRFRALDSSPVPYPGNIYQPFENAKPYYAGTVGATTLATGTGAANYAETDLSIKQYAAETERMKVMGMLQTPKKVSK